MNCSDWLKFFKEFWLEILFMTLFHMLLEIFIGFHDNFIVELFISYGYAETP
jgi:hypothetical protein